VTLRLPLLLSADLFAPVLRGPGPSVEDDDDGAIPSAGSVIGDGGSGGAFSTTAESTTTVVTGLLDGVTTSAFFAD
jgi:hypothetical protein